MGTLYLFDPCMITVYQYTYIYWFAQGLWCIGWNVFSDYSIELFPIHNWELVIFNVRIC